MWDGICNNLFARGFMEKFVNSLIKEFSKSSSNFVINECLDLRDKMLELIKQERLFKLNKRQTIINLIINLNKIVNLQ